MPSAAELVIVVCWTNAVAGLPPTITIAPSFEKSVASALAHPKLEFCDGPPAYETRAFVIWFALLGVPRNTSPTQSPAAGVAAADVNVTSVATIAPLAGSLVVGASST